MQMKKKGKVHPSPPSHCLNEDDSLSVLRLLPATILVLVSVLSAEDREVLAYLITRGISKKNKTKRDHKPPVFDCECFDCYTNYWFRWDSSPNRELIHQIIEAFENHHLGDSSVSKNKSKRGKKKEKKPSCLVGGEDGKPVVVEVVSVSESHVSSPDKLMSEAEVAKDEVVVEEGEESTVGFAASGHKGLVRKVLPDVLGLLNSSFWRLWNPNA